VRLCQLCPGTCSQSWVQAWWGTSYVLAGANSHATAIAAVSLLQQVVSIFTYRIRLCSAARLFTINRRTCANTAAALSWLPVTAATGLHVGCACASPHRCACWQDTKQQQDSNSCSAPRNAVAQQVHNASKSHCMCSSSTLIR
jgi:hypothetical protein